MGSSGSGRITDYPGSSKPSKSPQRDEGGAAGGGVGGGGGKPGSDDRCAKAFSVKLEDVEHSEFFAANGAAPKVGTVVTVEHRKRLVAVEQGEQSVGNLPTSMNYLAGCMKEGWKYIGKVQQVTNGSTGLIILVDFAPSR